MGEQPEGVGPGTGEGTGTVRHWSPDDGSGVVDVPGGPGSCAVDGSVVDGGPLRAGQPVRVAWERTPDGGTRVIRVVPDEELRTTPGA